MCCQGQGQRENGRLAKGMRVKQDTSQAKERVNEIRKGYVMSVYTVAQNGRSGDKQPVRDECVPLAHCRVRGGERWVCFRGQQTLRRPPSKTQPAAGHTDVLHTACHPLRHPSGTQKSSRNQSGGVDSSILQM